MTDAAVKEICNAILLFPVVLAAACLGFLFVAALMGFEFGSSD